RALARRILRGLSPGRSGTRPRGGAARDRRTPASGLAGRGRSLDRRLRAAAVSRQVAGLIRSEVEIDAGLQHVKILADADADRARAGRAAVTDRGTFQARVIRSEAEVVVFEKTRPAGREAKLHPRAGRPAPSGAVADREFEPRREEPGYKIAVLRPTGATLPIEQQRPPGIAEPAGDRAEQIDAALIMLGRRAELEDRIRM